MLRALINWLCEMNANMWHDFVNAEQMLKLKINVKKCMILKIY
jgi:hypothetical protein